MDFIDCTKRCTEKQMLNLKSKVLATDIFTIVLDDEYQRSFKSEDFIDLFEHARCAPHIQPETVMTFFVDDVGFMLLGKQYMKWCDPYYVERLKEIAVEPIKATKSKSNMHSVQIVSINESLDVVEEQSFSGIAADCIKFINKTVQKLKIKSFMKNEVMISVDNDDFYTIDKLLAKGVLV